MMTTPGAMLAVAALMMVSGCGLTASSDVDGYARLGSPGIDTRQQRRPRAGGNHAGQPSDVETMLSVSIGPSALAWLARHSDDDLEARALLQSLTGVRIKVYRINRNVERVYSRVRDISDGLEAEGWEKVVMAREQGEQVTLLAKMNADVITGLTLLAASDPEVVFINVIGDLDPGSLNKVLASLDVDVAPRVIVDGASMDSP
jgi:hypothetical protein